MNENVHTSASTSAASAAPGDGLPGPVDTPEVAKLVSDAKADGSAIAQAALASAKGEIDTAVTAAGKLISIAAGDETTLLTEAEAAAISIIAHNVPPQWQAAVSTFGALAASKVEGPLNEIVSAETQKGLVLAAGWLTVLQKQLDGWL
jgi:hypothetical protein